MIVDSSAMLAILFEEPEGRLLDAYIARNPVCRMSSAGFLEASMILQSRRGVDGVRDLDLLIVRFRIEIVAFTESQARLAREAFKRYGKGRHPAQLNFGDCLSYGAARYYRSTLLFKGDDFAQTDVNEAVRR